MGEKKHLNKIPPKIPGQPRENFVYVFFSLCVSFAPYLQNPQKHNKITCLALGGGGSNFP